MKTLVKKNSEDIKVRELQEGPIWQITCALVKICEENNISTVNVSGAQKLKLLQSNVAANSDSINRIRAQLSTLKKSLSEVGP